MYLICRFHDAAKVVSHSFHHRPQQALHTAIWWVEHVAHTGGAPLLKPSAVEMSRFVYYSLDVYAVLALVLGSIIASWVWLLRLCCGSNAAQKTKKD